MSPSRRAGRRGSRSERDRRSRRARAPGKREDVVAAANTDKTARAAPACSHRTTILWNAEPRREAPARATELICFRGMRGKMSHPIGFGRRPPRRAFITANFWSVVGPRPKPVKAPGAGTRRVVNLRGVGDSQGNTRVGLAFSIALAAMIANDHVLRERPVPAGSRKAQRPLRAPWWPPWSSPSSCGRARRRRAWPSPAVAVAFAAIKVSRSAADAPRSPDARRRHRWRVGRTRPNLLALGCSLHAALMSPVATERGNRPPETSGGARRHGGALACARRAASVRRPHGSSSTRPRRGGRRGLSAHGPTRIAPPSRRIRKAPSTYAR